MALSSSNELINYNGAVLPAGTALISSQNRGFRYGDGLFETILVKGGRIQLATYHFQRLFSGLRVLQLEIPSFFNVDNLSVDILDLCGKNGHLELSRVRLTVFCGDGGPFDEPGPLQYIIESSAIAPETIGWNDVGLTLGLFPGGRKANDVLANLKSNNYLIYILAGRWCRQQGLDDCMVLNGQGKVADTTIANLFYIRDGIIYTPPLSEGGVAGVRRSWLMEKWPIVEKETSPEDVAAADEVFLTNAIRGIRWVGSFEGRIYSCTMTRKIHEEESKYLLVSQGSQVR